MYFILYRNQTRYSSTEDLAITKLIKMAYSILFGIKETLWPYLYSKKHPIRLPLEQDSYLLSIIS